MQNCNFPRRIKVVFIEAILVVLEGTSTWVGRDYHFTGAFCVVHSQKDNEWSLPKQSSPPSGTCASWRVAPSIHRNTLLGTVWGRCTAATPKLLLEASPMNLESQECWQTDSVSTRRAIVSDSVDHSGKEEPPYRPSVHFAPAEK